MPNPKPTVNRNVTGAVIVADGEDDDASFIRKDLTDATDFKSVIIVNDKRIALSKTEVTDYKFADEDQIYTCCSNFNDVRFGRGFGADNNEYLFYNGNVTTKMPTSGIVNYTGTFIVSANADYSELEQKDFFVGKATFKADFTQKKFSGTLTQAELKPISIDAKIDGSGFIGTATSETFKTKANVDGKFYGNNAKELGGIYYDKEYTWGGAFGASQ